MTPAQIKVVYASQITAYSQASGLDPDLVAAVIYAESTGDPQAVSNKGAVGLMQLEPTTANLTPAQLTYADTNIKAGCVYLAQLMTKEQGNVPAALADYNAGPYHKGPLPDKTVEYINNVSTAYASLTGKALAAGAFVITTDYVADAAGAPETVAVSGTALTPEQYNSIYGFLSPSLIIHTNLEDQLAWFDDPDINLMRHRPKKEGLLEDFPVSFQVYFGPTPSSSRLPVSSIKLKASINSYEKSMQHVISKGKTRTGLMVDLWGMQLDTITGQGSTGLMQNQLGVTDYISLMRPNDEALAEVKYGFSIPSTSDLLFENDKSLQADAQAAVDAAVRQGFATPRVRVDGQTQLALSPNSFRVAARDAFAELLALFKNNGTVWYRNEAYSGLTTQQSQVGPDAWSPTNGLSTFQTMSSRNDVMTRGKVQMNFRNGVYSGYFKSLTWTMDAKNPFRWNFTFVFAVEKTTLSLRVV